MAGNETNHAMLKKSQKITNLSTTRGAPKWSFGGKPTGSEQKASTAPGPGQYVPSVDSKYTTLPSFSWGSAEQRVGQNTKWEDKKGTIPGPGAYNPRDPNSTSAKFGFGTGPRMPKRRVEISPPPGTYPAKSSLANNSCSMAGRLPGGRSISVPGPGAYSESIDPTRESAPSYGLGAGTRTDAFKDQKFPGPGNYGAPMRVAKGSPLYSFKSRRRPVKSDSTPGPIFAPYSQF